MLNESTAVDEQVLRVLDGIEMRGHINVTEDTILDNVRSAIRRGYKQVQPYAPRPERVIVLGGGPSLEDPAIQKEIRNLVFRGAKLVTVNGTYQWAIERNLQPKAHLVMDARPVNARFLQSDAPLDKLQTLVASQCAPDVFDAIDGRDDVWLFHAISGDEDTALKAILDEYYMGQWVGIGGGTTVVSRAVTLLRTLGYLRFDLFGVDSCWMNGAHHAYAQPENETDRCLPFKVHPTGHPELARTFWCAPWHVKQVEDFVQMIRVNGEHFLLNVHGDGLLAYILNSGADATVIEQAAEADVA